MLTGDPTCCLLRNEGRTLLACASVRDCRLTVRHCAVWAGSRVHAEPVNTRMHPDELEINERIVRRLIDEHFRQWRDMPLRACGVH